MLDQTLTQSVYGMPLAKQGWNAAAFRRGLERAQPLRGARRAAVFRRLADEFTRNGPIAIFGSWVWPEYFAPNVGCKVFQTVYAVADLGALCLTSRATS